MYAIDFEYDGLTLSDKGFLVCKFGSGGLETVSNGSKIVFNTIPTQNGAKHELTNTEYKECLTATIQICKDPDVVESREVTVHEIRDMMKWLNRKGFHKFKVLDFDYINIFWEATFNVKKIEINSKVYGFELELITNRPFALREPISIILNNTITNGTKRVYSESDDEGYIYPEMEIHIEQDGDFEIYNAFDNRVMRIANCTSGEIIAVNYPMISTSLDSHKIQNDFNWQFFRIARSFSNGANELTISLPCVIKLKYSPVVKVGL